MSALGLLKRTLTAAAVTAALAALFSTILTLLVRLALFVIRLLLVHARRQTPHPTLNP